MYKWVEWLLPFFNWLSIKSKSEFFSCYFSNREITTKEWNCIHYRYWLLYFCNYFLLTLHIISGIMPYCPLHPKAKQSKCKSCGQYKCCNPLIPGCMDVKCHRVVLRKQLDKLKFILAKRRNTFKKGVCLVCHLS